MADSRSQKLKDNTIYISDLNVGRAAMLLALLALVMKALNTVIYEI